MIKFKWHDGTEGCINDPVTIYLKDGLPNLSSVSDADGKMVPNVKSAELRIDADHITSHLELILRDMTDKDGLFGRRFIRINVAMNQLSVNGEGTKIATEVFDTVLDSADEFFIKATAERFKIKHKCESVLVVGLRRLADILGPQQGPPS